MFGAVLLCFVLSGFAALLYETAWMRQFSTVFGTSELAVVTVLSAYMGGLACGAALGERLVARVSAPLRAYAFLELGIALSALLVGPCLGWMRALQVAMLGGEPRPPDAGGWLGPLFYFGAGFLILCVPTALMGATLPLLTRHSVRRPEEIGERVGLLYAGNTAGAVAGTLAAAFILLPWLGLRGTVWVGVACNLAVFALAGALARGWPEPNGLSRREPEAPGRPSSGGWLLPMIAASGACSLAYEVLWTRLLSHVLGSSLFAFAGMLASFLAGLTLGSALASRRARTRAGSALGFGLAQLGAAWAGVLCYLGLGGIGKLSEGLALRDNATLTGYLIVAMAVMLPATLCLGATFPFAVRILADREADAPAAAARVYAWNTVGALLGAGLAGFLLLPGYGFEGTAVLLVTLNLLLAVGGAALARDRRWLSGVAIASLATILSFHPGSPEELLRLSPQGWKAEGEVVFSAVGRSSTVLVVENWGWLELRNNGLCEAAADVRGSPPSTLAETWLSTLPLLARPQARSLLLAGLGCGRAVEDLPPTVREVDVIELEEQVLAANRALAARRARDPLSDARLRVVLNDARAALALTTRRYDIIISQPSHPWTAGASHLYTREFVRLAREHLEEDGVFVQWIGPDYVDEPLLRSLAATLQAEFAFVQLYRPVPRMLIFLASGQPLAPERAAGDPSFRRREVSGPEEVVAALLLDCDGVRRLAAGAPPTTDDQNRLATRSLTIRPLRDGGVERLLAPLQPPVGASVDSGYLCHRLSHQGFRARALALAGDDPLARARALQAAEDGLGSLEAARAALARDPDRQEALFLLVRPTLWPIQAPVPGAAAARERLQGPGLRVATAAECALREEWDAVLRMDAELAAIPPRSVAFSTAQQLRAGARLAADRPVEALELLDGSLRFYRDPYSLALRAEAAAAARLPEAQLESMRRLVDILWWEKKRRPVPGGTLSQRVRPLLEDLPPDQVEGVASRLLWQLGAGKIQE